MSLRNVMQQFCLGDQVRDGRLQDERLGVVSIIDATPGGWLYGVKWDDGQTGVHFADELEPAE